MWRNFFLLNTVLTVSLGSQQAKTHLMALRSTSKTPPGQLVTYCSVPNAGDCFCTVFNGDQEVRATQIKSKGGPQIWDVPREYVKLSIAVCLGVLKAHFDIEPANEGNWTLNVFERDGQPRACLRTSRGAFIDKELSALACCEALQERRLAKKRRVSK